MPATTFSFISDVRFQQEARTFAALYAERRRISFELGRIASHWLEHYSRTNNAKRLADALYHVTGLQITGRSLRYFHDIYEMDVAWRQRGRAKCRNDFQIRHVVDGHLRVVAGAKLPTAVKCRLLDRIEREGLTVKRTTALARQFETAENRRRRTVRVALGGPRVYRGESLDVLKRVEPKSIHHLFADWQWENTGVWRESYSASPVHRPRDPVDHLCRLLESAVPSLHQDGIVWVFSKTTAFEGGQIGLPWRMQETAHRVGLRYCSEYVWQHTVAGHRSKNTFLAIKHTPIYPFVQDGFDFNPVEFIPSVTRPMTSPNHVSQVKSGDEKHPYQKPVELFEALIAAGSPNGLVYDAYAGSGAAGVAAVRSGCAYIGAEMQPHFVHQANRAIAVELGKTRSSSKIA